MRAPVALALAFVVAPAPGCVLNLPESVFDQCAFEDAGVEGVLSTATQTLDFDGVWFDSVGYSSPEGNCVTGVQATFRRGSGISCSLQMSTAPEVDSEGRLLIDELTLTTCDQWGLPSGTYSTTRSDQPLGTVAVSGGPDEDGVSECWEGAVLFELPAFSLDTGDGGSLDFEPSAITMLPPIDAGSNALACPTPA